MVSLRTVPDRFMQKVAFPTVERGCWLWTAATNTKGYGLFAISRRVQMAHRIAFECFRGPIPAGLTLDHICRNRACVNPRHLEPVSNRENILRGVGPSAVNARKTHCKRDHSLSGPDVYVCARGRRTCRACRRIVSAERRARLLSEKADSDTPCKPMGPFGRIGFLPLGIGFVSTDAESVPIFRSARAEG